MKYTLLLSLMASFHVAADIPHTFVSGAKAKAAEVNENFSYLNDEIENIKSFFDGPSGSFDYCTSNEDESPYPYTYSYTPAELGTSIYLGDDEYRLVKFPIVDKINGDIYHVTMPKKISHQTRPIETDYVNFSVNTNSYGEPQCKDSTVFGDLAYFSGPQPAFTLNRSINYSNDGDNDDYGTYNDTAISEKISYSNRVYIGNMSFYLSIYNTVGISKKIVSSDDYDFTDDIPDTTSFDYANAASELTNFLNHIRIEKAE